MNTFYNLGVDPKGVSQNPCIHSFILCCTTGLSGSQILHARIPSVKGVPHNSMRPVSVVSNPVVIVPAKPNFQLV